MSLTGKLHLHILPMKKPNSPKKEMSVAKMGSGSAKDAVFKNMDDDDVCLVHGMTGDDANKWPQFPSLWCMRTGTLYHHLEVSESWIFWSFFSMNTSLSIT